MNWSKHCWLIITLTFAPYKGFSQIPKLDSIIRIIDFKKDSVLSVFRWIADEIKYDPQSKSFVNRVNSYGLGNQSIVEEAILKKRGTCLHYAELFKALLNRLGYESYVIDGYTIEQASNDKYGHAWNVVKIKSEWFLYDPTWAAGYITKFKFIKSFDRDWYKVKPNKFIVTHVPFDPIWQLLNPPLSFDSIKSGDFDNLDTSIFRLQDSIRIHVESTTRDRIFAALRRIKEMGIHNESTKAYVHDLEQYLKNSNDYAILQSALKQFNRTVSFYNEYILSKSRQFNEPIWTDSILRIFSNQMKVKIDSSSGLLNMVCTTNFQVAQFQIQLQMKIRYFMNTISVEEGYIQKYLSTSRLPKDKYLQK